MPPSSLPNVLDGLDRFPHWKVSFEIEPYSWAIFEKSDPKSIERLRMHLKDQTPAGRIEFVSGAYGQTYAWNTNGECNIRQLLFGRAELHAVFPDLVVDTYAVQEPCWTSCLPQLLKSLGYRRAVLKNSTCWCGYHAPTFDADLIKWTGPDGTSLPTVPRYVCEKLSPPATIESAQPTPEFIARCRRAGIKNPAGTILQDMGWPGRPWRFAMSEQVLRALRQVTWREYVETVATPASQTWRATQEDLRVGLAWGASVLQRIAQVVRSSEGSLIQAEKMASMAFVQTGLLYPQEALREAWKNLLWSQHHDVWIVPYNHHKTGTWASAADEKFGQISESCGKIVAASAAAVPHGHRQETEGRQVIRVFNTTGFQRRDLAEVQVAMHGAGQTIQVRNSKGDAVPCQPVASADETSTTLLFPADVPAMGYATYVAETIEAPAPQPAKQPDSPRTSSDGKVNLESDLYTLTIDPQKGGRIVSLFSKALGREFVDSNSVRGFNEFRGYFSNAGGWLSSLDAPATVTVTEHGPLRKTVRIDGRIGAWPFATTVSLAEGRRRIDFQTSFDLPFDSPPFERRHRGAPPSPPAQARFRVGEPWEAGRDVLSSGRRPQYDSSFKLQALFPTALNEPTLYKNAAFDVCEASSLDTRFNSWNSIKNNVVLNWLDLVQKDCAAGLAIMVDHTTAYSVSPGEPLGLVACYAGPGVWFDYNLGRAPCIGYSVLPHTGDWAQAQLWRELARWSEPLVARAADESGTSPVEWSLIDASENGIDVSAVLLQDDHLLLRLFNAEGNDAPTAIALSSHVKKVELVQLDGRVIAELPIAPNESGQQIVTASLPRFAVRTLRCSLI